MALNLFLRRIQQGAADGNALVADIKRVFMDYLQSDVISHWKEDIRSFLMQVSVVDAFTLELAEAITGEDDAASLLHRAEQAGNILQCDGGEWHIRPVLLEALREQALVVFGHKCIYQLMYNAGRYCETSGQTMRALRLYQRCGDADSIRSLLLREARKHPGVGSYWALRQYYQALSEEDVQNEPVLMSALSVLYSVLMNTEKSEYWYQRLKEYAAASRGNARSEANGQVFYLDIVLPHRGSREIARILPTLFSALHGSGNVLRPVSLTNNQPSLMNGGKDFCEWSKTDLFLANTLGPVVEKMLGKAGIGLVQTALGESAYEKGEDRFKVLSRLTKAQNQCENNGIVEMLWVDIALQARLALSTGDMEYARRLAAGMLQRCEREGLSHLSDSVSAFSCWLGLYQNETGKIRSWMERVPDETVEFCTLNRYLYMTKIYGYIALGKHTDAQALIRRMLLYADYAQRTYIQMDMPAFERRHSAANRKAVERGIRSDPAESRRIPFRSHHQRKRGGHPTDAGGDQDSFLPKSSQTGGMVSADDAGNRTHGSALPPIFAGNGDRHFRFFGDGASGFALAGGRLYRKGNLRKAAHYAPNRQISRFAELPKAGRQKSG